MGLKKRNKVSAEFSMSSLTDIIFLLLIFFMLTSSLVSPNALNLKLPSSSRSNTSSNTKITDVQIKRDGRFQVDGRRVSASSLEGALAKVARSSGSKKASITISPHEDTPVEFVVQVMDIAMRYNINAILAASPD